MSDDFEVWLKGIIDEFEVEERDGFVVLTRKEIPKNKKN